MDPRSPMSRRSRPITWPIASQVTPCHPMQWEKLAWLVQLASDPKGSTRMALLMAMSAFASTVAVVVFRAAKLLPADQAAVSCASFHCWNTAAASVVTILELQLVSVRDRNLDGRWMYCRGWWGRKVRGAVWVICESRDKERSRRARPRDGARNAELDVAMMELDEVDLQSLQILWARRILVNAHSISLKYRFQDFLGESALANKRRLLHEVNHLNGSIYSLDQEGGGRCKNTKVWSASLQISELWLLFIRHYLDEANCNTHHICCPDPFS